MRQLQFEKGKKSKKESPSETKAEQILEKYAKKSGKQQKIFAEKLTYAEISELVDLAVAYHLEAKALEEEAKKAKEILLAHAKKKGWKDREGTLGGRAVILESSKTETKGIKDFLQLLVKEGKKDLFYDLVGIKLTQAKKALGEDLLNSSGFLKVIREEFGKVRLDPPKRM